MADASAANDFTHEPGLSLEEMARRYSAWAQGAKYEKDLCPKNFRGPSIAAEFASNQFPDLDKRREMQVLDVAAGTGLAGEKLHAKGFTKLDALEPSEGMLNLAKSKGIYTRTFRSFLNGKPLEIETDYYDLAIICGGMGEGHIPCTGLDELTRVVKPGGLVINVMREAYLTTVAEYKDRLEPHWKELELEGRWETVSRTVVPRYSFDNNGVVFIFRVKDGPHKEG